VGVKKRRGEKKRGDGELEGGKASLTGKCYRNSITGGKGQDHPIVTERGRGKKRKREEQRGTTQAQVAWS